MIKHKEEKIGSDKAYSGELMPMKVRLAVRMPLLLCIIFSLLGNVNEIMAILSLG